MLLPPDADKGRQGPIPGNEILEKAGMRGDIHHQASDLFHSSAEVPNSLRRVAGDRIALLKRREGFSLDIMPTEEASKRFLDGLRMEAEEYLAAAAVLNGTHYGRINLLRFAARNILVGLLTKAGIHVGGEPYGPRGKSALLRHLPPDVAGLAGYDLEPGILLLEWLNELDPAEMHEFVSQPPAEDMVTLDRLQACFEKMLLRL